MKQIKVFTLGLTASLLMACTANNEIDNISNTNDNQGEVVNYTIDEALKTLNDFLATTDEGGTRSGHTRTVESVSYYTTSQQTRSTNEEDINKAAYLVNFANDEGFAVLGANSSVPNIIAVLDNGHINEDFTVSFPDEYNDVDASGVATEIPEWCDADDDFYAAVSVNARNTTRIIETMMKVPLAPTSGGSDKGGSTYFTCNPLIDYNWSQGEPQNKYCYIDKVKKTKHAYTRCSNTALAMIMAYNEFPQNLYVNDEKIDWENMKAFPDDIL